jgi:hypothetical protein
MHRESTALGWLRNGNRQGNPATAPRCGARTRAGTACQAPAMRTKRRCRLHGGESTGPTTLEGLARIRAARTEGRAMEAWRRRYIRNGYRSIAALGEGRICGMDGQAYLRALVAREEAEGIALALVEAERQAVRAALTQRDVARLRLKVVIRADPT